MDVTEAFCEIIENEGLTRQNLADKMGKTRGFVSQILNGSRNMTLGTMAEIALSLGYKPEVKFEKATEKSTISTSFTVDMAEDDGSWTSTDSPVPVEAKRVAVNG